MKTKNPAPVQNTKGFLMMVMPSRNHLDTAIAHNGFCHPKKCWHKVAINAIAIAWGEGNAHVRVDAGHIKLNYKGWRYIADTPRHVKRSLMLFDKKLYDEVHVREYNLRFRRTTKIVPVSRERLDRNEETRQARIEAAKQAGNTEHVNKVYPSMRLRVEGFSSIV